MSKKLGEGATPGPCFARVNEDGQPCVYDQWRWLATCSDIETANYFAKAPLLVEARDVLQMAKVTIERLTPKRGPFETLNALDALLAKLEAE